MSFNQGTLAEISGVLQEYYVFGLNEQMNVFHPFLGKMMQAGNIVPAYGNAVHFNLDYGVQGGIGSRSDGAATLPSPRTGDNTQAVVNMKFFYARADFSLPQVEATRGNVAAFAEMITREIDALMRDTKTYSSLINFLGQKGVIASVATTDTAPGSSPTTIVVDSAIGFTEGDVIDILTSAGASIGATHEDLVVLAYDVDAKTVTVDADIAVTATNIITRADSYNTSLTGFADQFTPDTTLHGIDRSAAAGKFYNPGVVYSTDTGATGGTAEVLDTTTLRKAKNKANRLGRYRVDTVFANFDEVAGYESTLEDNVRFSQGNDGTAPWLKGGYSMLMFDDIEFFEDKHATQTDAFMLAMPTWEMLEMVPWNFMDKEGSIFERIKDKAGYEMSMYNYKDCANTNLRSNVIIKEIAVPTA